MYVPDDAKQRRRLDRLTSAEWYVYEAHCERRMAKTGLSDATNAEIAEREHLALKTVQNAMSKLRKLGWLQVEEGGVRLLVGDFHPVDKKHAKASLSREPEAESIPYTGNLFPDMGNDLPCTGNELPCTGNDAYIGTRARSDQPLPATSTHTPAPASAPPADEAPAARVCVLSFEDYLGYAQSEPGFTNPPAWAMKHFALRDADPLVAGWKGRRELVLEGRAPVETQLTPYHVAAQTVASVAQLPGYDVAGYIEQMQEVSEETRAKLRRTFLVAPARAHAPP
jgi:hypothetical protein